MSAGKNIAIGCGVIVLAMVAAGWLGIRWVQENLGVTWDDQELLTWSEEMIGTTPLEGFEPTFGMFAGEDHREALLIFVKSLDRGSEVALTMLQRPGAHDFESIFQDVDTGKKGVYLKFASTVGDEESYFASWGEVQVPVHLEEGYAEGEVLSRQVLGIIPFEKYSVALLFQGSPDSLDRNIVQQMLDRIPDGWQPQPFEETASK